MPSKSPRTPRDLKIKRLPQVGERLALSATVTRTGRNGFNTGDTITVKIPGFATPITIDAAYLEKADD